MQLGSFDMAEEAALCYARTPEAREAAVKVAAASPLAAAEALRQAQAEGLTLLTADSSSGYKGVSFESKKAKPYKVKVHRGGKQVSLGYYATAEAAALCYARMNDECSLFVHSLFV